MVSLQYGGVSSWAEGILQVDVQGKKAQWLQLQQKGGRPQDAIFILAAAAAHSNTIQISDANNDGRTELLEVFSQTLFDETECDVNAYVWNGNLFLYDSAVSQHVLGQLTPSCEF